jgi:cell division protein FtsW
MIGSAPDLGTAALFFAIAMLLFIVGGIWSGWIAIFAAILAVGIGFQKVLLSLLYESYPHALKRIDPWLKGEAFHTNVSEMALGSGGFWGMGLGQGSSKLGYLPESQTDFIFAIIGQELGFAGAFLVIAVFLWITWHGLRLALSAKSKFERMVVFGVTMMIACQALMNIGVCTGLLPPKGIQLPFVSYGGSGLIANCIMIGLLASNVNSEKKAPPLIAR